ncbi:MAG: aromatic prenyltransferase [Candidatus Hermodarchaeota archaeon]
MEWQPEVKQLFESVVLGVPEMVRPAVKPALFEGAEQKCKERNGKTVSEMDLVVALFEVTPPAFQPTMIEDLKKHGIDHNRYLSKIHADFKLKNDINQLVKDIVKISDFTGVKSNEEAIWKGIKAYEEFFAGAPLSIRTTTKSKEKRDVAARYVEFFIPHKPDPYTTAINEGILVNDGHPIHDMIVEVINSFEIMGYGVDIDARTGLSKIWPFVVPGSIDPIFTMKSIPTSIKNCRDYFVKHKLTAFSLFAFDFLNNTTNIYFMLQQPAKSSFESCVNLVEELGFKIASEDAMKGCAEAAHLNYTFSWDSDKVERLCFGITSNDPSEVPMHLHPLISEFIEKAPLQSNSRKLVWGVTFSNNGLYYKIENDYNGAMVDFLQMGCKAGLDSYD